MLFDLLKLERENSTFIHVFYSQALLERREFFARTEDQLRNKLVTLAVSIFRERLDRKDSKREDRAKKTPVMTLRDAFELRKMRERAQNGEDCETDPELALADSVGAVQLHEKLHEVVAEVEDEVSEEVQEEEPAAPEPEDPAKIQAALEAAREKKRQQDAESRRLRSRQQEKKGNPKYQEMMDRRSTLPAFLMRDTILEAIDKHSVVVISGDTGASQCLSFLCVRY